jgi:hypothetical protein
MDIVNAANTMAQAIINAVNAGMQFGIAAPVMVPLLTGMAGSLSAI